jgi:hypothetical protein
MNYCKNIIAKDFKFYTMRGPYFRIRTSSALNIRIKFDNGGLTVTCDITTNIEKISVMQY